MRCNYTHIEITRRYGVPQAYTAGSPLQLVGCYGSVGVLIRSLISKVTADGVEDHILSSLSRIGAMIGRPLKLTKTEKGDTTYSKEELKALTDLAAPDAGLLEINGGRMTVAEFIKKDKTWDHPDFRQYGQTADEVAAQKTRMNEKRAVKRAAKFGKKDEPFRIFYFGLEDVDDKNVKNISRISAESLNDSGFLTKPKEVRVIETDKGLRICLSGGSSHNKAASKKWYGASWKSEKPVKGDAVIILTNGAPLVMDEYLEEDDTWLTQYKKEKYGVLDPATVLSDAISKKQKTSN